MDPFRVFKNSALKRCGLTNDWTVVAVEVKSDWQLMVHFKNTVSGAVINLPVALDTTELLADKESLYWLAWELNESASYGEGMSRENKDGAKRRIQVTLEPYEKIFILRLRK